MIKIINLSKRFQNKVAVDNLNLEVKSGELFSFIGPNAAGKTTTIKLITGLLKPTSGKIFVKRYDIQKDYNIAKKFISYIPDFPYLYEKLTAVEFLRFIGKIYGMGGTQITESISKYLSLFELEEYQDQLIQNFSHGIRQKFTFIAAFLHNPEILIIDEPFVGLDPKSTKLVKNLLKSLVKKGVSIFMSTHTLSVAEELADRIGVIDKGTLIACGTVQQLTQISGTTGKLEEIFLKLTKEDTCSK